jgi:hypothetical protein
VADENYDYNVMEMHGDLGRKAKSIVFEYVRDLLDKSDAKHKTFSIDEVYVVWFCKTLQNWKALISTTLPDGMYYEVTHNGNENETYLDAYKKFDNQLIQPNKFPYGQVVSSSQVG